MRSSLQVVQQHTRASAAHFVQVGCHPAAPGLQCVRHSEKLPQRVIRSGHLPVVQYNACCKTCIQLHPGVVGHTRL